MSISATIRAGAAYVEVTAQTSKLQQGLRTAQAQLQTFGRSCTSIGKDMLMLSGALAAPLVMAVRSFTGFDDQMRLAKAVTQATAAEFESMTKVAAKLGRETSFTAKQVADGMVSLGRMGFSPKEIEQSIQPTLDLARATGTDLGEAADIAANSMRIFGIEASKMSDVADVLTATANGSAQTLTDLFEALKMAGPQAKAAGENITDTSAAIGVLANLGIKGSLAGTALRKSFSQFAKTRVQEQLKGFGIATVDANGNLRKMADIIADIGKVMAGMATAEKIAFAEDIFDVRGSLAGLSLGGNVKELNAFMAKLKNIQGTARTTAQEMDAGLGGSFRMLMSAVEGAMNAIAKALEGTLKPLVDRVTEVTLAVIRWIEANSGLVTAFAVTVTGAAALGAGLLVIGVAAKGAAAGIAVVQGVLKSFAFLQGVCIAQGAGLKNCLMLIASAFANFRNMAIPAMVGAEQLCAAFGAASTTATRTAASIVLMGNAEAAATAKSILAAKWNAMTTALKAFRSSAIAATIATKAQAAAEAAMAAKNALVSGWNAMAAALKGMTAASAAATAATYAHTAAEAVCTAGTVLLNKARTAAIATTALFTAANLKAVVSISAVAAGNFLLAAAAKVAAVAMLTLSAVMTAIAAHPVAAALIALGAVLAGVMICLYRSSSYTAKLSDRMSKLRETGDELRKTDQLRMERLRQLSEKQRLSNAEMAEAGQLAKELKQRYGDLGITITDNTVRLRAMDSAASRLGDVEMRVRNLDDLDRLRRLKDLSLKVRLTVPEQNEAAGLIETLSAKYGSLGMAVDRTAKKVVLFNQAAQRIQGFTLKTRVAEPDLPKFNRLKQLSMMPELDLRQQGEAGRLIAELSAKYGHLGLAVNRATGEIQHLNTVAGAMTDLHFRIRGTEDLQKFQRLKALSLQSKIDFSGEAEAQRLIADLTRKYGSLGIAVEHTGGRIRAVSDTVAHLDQVRLRINDADIRKFDRLKELKQMPELSAGGQQEAVRLIDDLTRRYGNLGIAVDRANGRIVQMNTAMDRMPDMQLKIEPPDMPKFDRLKSLTQKVQLDAGGQQEAERLIGDLSRKYGDLGLAVDRAGGRIVQLNTAAGRLQDIRFRIRDDFDMRKLDRLKELSFSAKLSVGGQNEAERLIGDLSRKYGDLGIAVDRASGRIVQMNTAMGRMPDMRLKIEPPDMPKFDRLQTLTQQIRLDAGGQQEAERLIGDLSRKYGDLGIMVDRTSGKIRSVREDAGRMPDLRFQADQRDLPKFDRLKALTQEVRLNAGGQQEAEELIAELSRRYGDLGITVDKVTGRIVRMNTVAGNLQSAGMQIVNQRDLDKLDRLQSMSRMPGMNEAEQKHAAELIAGLEQEYGSLGVTVDKTSGRIVRLTDAANRVHNVELSVKDSGELDKFSRLKTLSMQTELDVRGQQEASALIAQLSARYGDLGVAVDGTAGKIVRLNTAAGRLQDVRYKIKDETDLAKFDRLKKLSAQITLTTEGRAEAEKLVTELSAKYGNLGVAVDAAAGKITAMNAAAARISAVEPEIKQPEDYGKLLKLKALSLEISLDRNQQHEAESLIRDLTQQYGELGVEVDRASGRIVNLNSVAAGLREIKVRVSGTEDAAKASRLQELAAMPKLDASGISEAGRLIAGLKDRYGEIGVAVDAAQGRIVALTAAQKQLNQAQNVIRAGSDPQKEAHLAQLERLRQIAGQERVTAAEQAEAQNIVDGLNAAYNNLGLGIDAITGKLNIATTAQQKLNNAMQQASAAQIDAEIAEMEANITELKKENEALMGYWNHNLMSQVTGKQAAAMGQYEANLAKLEAYRQKILALQKRKKAVKSPTQEAPAQSSTAENIAAENQRRAQSKKASDDAAGRVAEIEKRLARERQTDLQNEIDDIIALRDEYKALIQTMLDYEKSRPKDQQDRKKIQDLEGKLAGADRTADERIRRAKDKDAERMQRETDGWKRHFEDSDRDRQQRKDEAATDRRLDRTMESDPEAGKNMLQLLVDQYRRQAQAIREQFDRELADAQKDGKIDDRERGRLNDTQSAYDHVTGLLDKYESRLSDAQEGTRQVRDRTEISGNFLAKALTYALGGSGNEAARTADATEQMARQTKETNKLLKRMGSNGSSTLVYT